MKKKIRQNFSIKLDISNDFKKICDEKSINMSKLIENFMKEFIIKNETK